MFSIQRILGHDQKFYDLLEASAQQADASVHHLIALLEKLEKKASPQSLEEFVQSRRKDKQITQELTEQLCKTFITPLEREDIQALSAALYKIPKTVEKIGERVLICPQDLQGRSFDKQVELLDQAAETVLAQGHRRGDGARDERKAPVNRGRRRQTGTRLVARSLSGRLRNEADHLSAGSIRVDGKGSRPLPGRGKYRSRSGVEIFVAGRG